MSDSQATTNETPGRSGGPGSSPRVFMDFWFLKIDGRFTTLMSNEKVVARQEFLATLDQFPHRLPVVVYALDGLSADADILIWRVSPDLEDFHTMSTRLRRSGFGRYLIPARSYTGTVPAAEYPFEPRRKGAKEAGPIGNRRFLLIAPVSGANAEALRAGNLESEGRLHVLDGRGLDETPWLAAYETDDPTSFARLLARCAPDAQPPTTVCVRKDATDLIESAG